ncbi:MAG: phosphate propanoyltransferase [Negativicutes bacterium]|nr:phosphate propanoyltransferase [Negativicutes bacterium]
MDPRVIETVVACVVKCLADASPADGAKQGIPVGVSNRHIHLAEEAMAVLFGASHQLTQLKALSQVGEFAAAETVTLVGPKGVIQGVRILGPLRDFSQVEISRTDGFLLGIRPPVRDSGQIVGSAGITLVGPAGGLTLAEGVIIAARHIHMSDADAAEQGLREGDRVAVETCGPRAVCFQNVLVRVGPKFRREFHIDTDEANAAELNNGDLVRIVRD